MNLARHVPMHELEPNQCGVVSEVLAPDGDLSRLMAMGVCRGRTIMLVKRGNPLVIKVFGSRIGLSERLAARVMVEPCAEGACVAEHRETARPD